MFLSKLHLYVKLVLIRINKPYNIGLNHALFDINELC